jgi:hypothetical protein
MSRLPSPTHEELLDWIGIVARNSADERVGLLPITGEKHQATTGAGGTSWNKSGKNYRHKTRQTHKPISHLSFFFAS